MAVEFETVLASCQAPLRAYIAGRGIHATAVDDVAQEVFLAFYRDRERLPPGVEPIAWLKGVARNLCNNHFRAEERRGRLLMQIADCLEELPTSIAEQEEPQLMERLRACLGHLQPRVREAVVSYYAEAGQEELARRLELGSSGLRMLVHRAREQLRRCLGVADGAAT
jgi:RNA polymerase sigma-70 factor, ECF subfamily